MQIIIYSLAALIIILIIVLVILNSFLKKDELTLLDDNAKVSILIAARNEEKNIIECLQSVQNLVYSNFEVWIGNDHSTDKTEELISDFIKDKPNFHLLNISENLDTAKGKANVLAQLAHKASGDYFFITDADIEVPETWINGMLSSFKKDTGIVSGFTISKGDSFFEKMQRVDWAYAMGMVKVVSDFGKPIVGIGNNMAVTREAYFATGGYENLPFSIVEDYQLFTEITQKGYGFANLLTDEITAISKPIDSFLGLLQQRKRWMFGAFQLPASILSILLLQASYYSIAIVLCILDFQLGFNIVVLKMFLQALFVRSVFTKTRKEISFVHLLLFDFYQLGLSSASLLFYVLPFKIKWKGREY